VLPRPLRGRCVEGDINLPALENLECYRALFGGAALKFCQVAAECDDRRVTAPSSGALR